MPARPSTSGAPARSSSTGGPSTASNRYAPPRAAVRDVTDYSAGDEPADRSTRLAAAILDSLIAAAMIYGPMLLGLTLGGVIAGSDGAGTMVIATVALTLVGFVAWCWLTIKYVIENGQTIAKKLLNIKVVRSDGSPITLGRIFWLRNFLNGVISIVPLYGLIELLFIFGESRQCLHDKIADTIVVKA
jgi:uncharacterized RDD family membrane protein YckC